MSSKKALAIANFKHGHNCAQAVVCAYCEEYGVSSEDAFRLSEGFGGGVPGLKTICGAASGMVMVASLKNCPSKDVENTTKKVTYPCVMNLVNEFQSRMGEIECKNLLAIKDNTLVDGKKKGCIECVACACDLIEEYVWTTK